MSASMRTSMEFATDLADLIELAGFEVAEVNVRPERGVQVFPADRTHGEAVAALLGLSDHTDFPAPDPDREGFTLWSGTRNDYPVQIFGALREVAS